MVLFLSGCKDPMNNKNQPTDGNLIKSSLERDTSPTLAEGELNRLVTDNTTFALNFYHQVKGTAGNLLFSPHSISTALAMTYAGALGNTETQMARALQFNLSQDRLHPAFNALDLALNSRGKNGTEGNGTSFRLNIVNATWGQKGYSFLSDFLDVLALNYGAGMRVLDFSSNPDAARITINDWVAKQTEDRIKDLLPDGSVTQDTRLVLTNAIYFFASWAIPFDKTLTTNGAFYLLDGTTVSAPMMTLSPGSGEKGEKTAGAVFDGYLAVELPYVDDELSMVLLVPDQGRFFEVEQAINTAMIQAVFDSLGHRTVNLVMPKFGYESTFLLKDTLTAMGMPEAFDDRADFSGMTGARGLCIGDVYHNAFITVDEAGTEAAAATAVTVYITSIELPPMSVAIDRPFIYFIRDIETGAILFMGRVLNPVAN